MSNKVELIGNVGKEGIKFQEFENGKKLAQFSMATNEKFTDKATGEVKQNTDWHNCKTWSKLAEDAKQFNSGDWIKVTGKLKTDNYETEGVKKSFTYVLVTSIETGPTKKIEE